MKLWTSQEKRGSKCRIEKCSTRTHKFSTRNQQTARLRQVDCPCGKSFLTVHASRRWHSNACRKAISKVLRNERPHASPRKLVYGTQGSHTEAQWLTKLKLSAYLCFWCGRELWDKHVTKDHLQPLSRGGSDDITNVVPACRSCNSRKGSKTADEFRQYLDQRALERRLFHT